MESSIFVIFLIDFFSRRYLSRINDPNHIGEVTAETEKLGVGLLEAGIIFHSVFIGLTLAITTGGDFISLWITIIFHRMLPTYAYLTLETFEGLALGSRIAPLQFPSRSWKPYIWAIAYAVTTPAGMALGLAIRTTYDPNFQTALITCGVFDGLSAGLLIYNSMVTLLADDFLHGEMLRAKNWRITVALSCMIVGTALMSLLGRWA